MRIDDAPLCPGDGLAMMRTVVGWRCPVCGLAALRAAESARELPHLAPPPAG